MEERLKNIGDWFQVKPSKRSGFSKGRSPCKLPILAIPTARSQLRQDNIVPYLTYQGWEDKLTVEIFMLVYEGNLKMFITQPGYKSATEAVRQHTVYRMLKQILPAIDHMHTKGIIHRDIKPENILFNNDNFYLTDFGIAKLVNDNDRPNRKGGTHHYMLPEIRKGGVQTTKVDIYGLGATLMECLELNLPAKKDLEDWHRYIQKLIKKRAPILEDMLADDPNQRPTARSFLDSLEKSTHALQSS